MISAAARIAGAIADLVYPPSCIGCGARIEGDAEGHLCAKCNAELPVMGQWQCPRCGDELGPYAEKARACPSECQSKSLYFQSATAVCRYEGVAREMVHRLKYSADLRAAAWMGSKLGERLQAQEWFSSADVLIPVPLHWTRRLSRRFNQSELLAGGISRATGKPYDFGAFVRARRTSSQTTLEFGDRLENVKGAFRIRRRGVVEGKRVVLVDDVMTTCATAAECARVLKDAGAKAVYIAIFAR